MPSNDRSAVEVIVQVRSTTALETVQRLARKAGGTMQPPIPGPGDDVGPTYFAAARVPLETHKGFIDQASQLPEVLAAYAKPAGQPP
jgi:hypothetical protein